jgi:hypothetical protein
MTAIHSFQSVILSRFVISHHSVISSLPANLFGGLMGYGERSEKSIFAPGHPFPGQA